MNKIESAVELFDQVVDLIGAIVGSFNKDAFPITTFGLINSLKNFIQQNTSILTFNKVESQLRNALLDLNELLNSYLIECNTKDTKLFSAVQKKDFVTARNIFKRNIIQKFFLLLSPEEKGLTSPSNVWKAQFSRLSKILGVI